MLSNLAKMTYSNVFLCFVLMLVISMIYSHASTEYLSPLAKYDPKYEGTVTYLTNEEALITEQFIDLEVGRQSDIPHRLLLINSAGYEFEIDLRFIKKINMLETIPHKVVESWPKYFGRKKDIPKIEVEIEQFDGSSKVYSMYATYWIYFLEKKGAKKGLYPCRIKEIQILKSYRPR